MKGRNSAILAMLWVGVVLGISQGWFSNLHRMIWNATRLNDLTGVQSTTESAVHIWPWLPMWGALTLALALASESDRYGSTADALAWLVAIGATTHFWSQFSENLIPTLTGSSPTAPVTPSPGGHGPKPNSGSLNPGAGHIR